MLTNKLRALGLRFDPGMAMQLPVFEFGAANE